MKNITVLFKSGATVSFKANYFDGKQNGFGQLTSLQWNCDGLNKYPIKINLENIDAILIEEDEE